MNSWINAFVISLNELEHESNVDGSTAWTAFLTKVMHRIGQKLNCYVQSKNVAKDLNSGEYLNIDALFFKNDDCKNWDSDYPPPIFPYVAVELENDYSHEKIAYCLWKIICIRCEIRVLICHQSNRENLSLLKEHLDGILRKSNLFIEPNKRVFVVISDEASGNLSWKDYYSVFEWQNEQLEKLEVFN